MPVRPSSRPGPGRWRWHGWSCRPPAARARLTRGQPVAPGGGRPPSSLSRRARSGVAPSWANTPRAASVPSPRPPRPPAPGSRARPAPAPWPPRTARPAPPPGRRRAAQPRRRGRRPGEQHRTAAVVGHRAQGRGLVGGGDLGQLAGGVRAASTSPTASRISTWAGSSWPAGTSRRSRRRPGGSPPRPPPPCPGPAAAAPAPAAAPGPGGWPAGRRRRRP